jgi:hypothetical protein
MATVALAWNFLWWPQSGQWYAFWSSFGACLTYFAVITVAYRHLKCKSCWRIAHHRVEGTHYKTCHLHATPAEHARLSALHAHKFPEQHELLGRPARSGQAGPVTGPSGAGSPTSP